MKHEKHVSWYIFGENNQLFGKMFGKMKNVWNNQLDTVMVMGWTTLASWCPWSLAADLKFVAAVMPNSNTYWIWGAPSWMSHRNNLPIPSLSPRSVCILQSEAWTSQFWTSRNWRFWSPPASFCNWLCIHQTTYNCSKKMPLLIIYLFWYRLGSSKEGTSSGENSAPAWPKKGDEGIRPMVSQWAYDRWQSWYR